eukprot:1150287-Pelagomonas_calceolata.AAC.5
MTDGSAIGVDVGERSLGMLQYGGTYMQADAVFEATKKQKQKGKVVAMRFCGSCGHLRNSGAVQPAKQALQRPAQPIQPS